MENLPEPTPGMRLPPLTIEALVNGGSGLARYQGRIVFVPHTCVGDQIVARVIKVKKHFAEAVVDTLLVPGADRINPHCPVAGQCGGCQWQHLPYTVQLQWKEKLFKETLLHVCDLDEARLLPIIPSADQRYYRSRVQMKCHNTPQGLVTGFYRSRSRYVIGVDECPITDHRLNSLLKTLRDLISATCFASYIPQIDLYIDDLGKRGAVVHYIGRQKKELTALLMSVSREADLMIQFGTKNTLTRISGDGLLTVLVDNPPLRLRYACGSFAQVNLSQNKALVDLVMTIFPWSKEHRVLELYCGMGNFSFPLARRVKHVTGIEESSASIRMAKDNAVANGINNVEFHAKTAEETLEETDLFMETDVVVLDPPRSGAMTIMKGLLNYRIPNIVYISCDPQTLARDLRSLVHAGYHIVCSRPLDMFPQTHHCESVTVLRSG